MFISVNRSISYRLAHDLQWYSKDTHSRVLRQKPRRLEDSHNLYFDTNLKYTDESLMYYCINFVITY